MKLSKSNRKGGHRIDNLLMQSRNVLLFKKCVVCVAEVANRLSSGLIVVNKLVFIQISKCNHLVYPQSGFRSSVGRENRQ